ncbi:MAG: SRPBCC domain-containing protein [Planctomycetota bacterium]
MRPRFIACCISLSAACITGCTERSTDDRAALTEAEIRLAVPPGWAVQQLTLEAFQDTPIAGRSDASFEVVAAPSAALGALIETIDGTNIVRVALDPTSDAQAGTVTFTGDATHIAPPPGTDRQAAVRVSIDRGVWSVFEGNAATLLPLPTLSPYVLEGSVEANSLREARAARLVAEAEAEEAAKVARAEAASSARLERERIDAEERLERQRLRRLDLNTSDGRRWIDRDSFVVPGQSMLDPIEIETFVALQPSEVFDLWTTEAGVEAFLGVGAMIDLKIGGAYEWYLAPDNPEGERGNEGGRVLAYDPGRSLVFSWIAPPNFPDERGPKTWVFVTFEEAEGGTNVTLRHTGFPNRGEWPGVRAYFEPAWGYVLSKLAESGSQE